MGTHIDGFIWSLSSGTVNLFPTSSCIYRLYYTWSTGAGTRKGSRKARGVRSWLRQSAKCAKIDSTEWRGCCRVTRKYFWRARAIEGNTAWAASCGSIGIAGTVRKLSHDICLYCEKWMHDSQLCHISNALCKSVMHQDCCILWLDFKYRQFLD